MLPSPLIITIYYIFVLFMFLQEYVNIKDDVRSVKSVKVGQCANIIEFGEDVMIVAEMRNVSTTDPGQCKDNMIFHLPA